MAERVLSNVAQVNDLGSQVPYNCPHCGGVLWDIDNPDIEKYRCRMGHSFTDAALFISQSQNIEKTLRTALRIFEERKTLLNNMALRVSHTRGRILKRSARTKPKSISKRLERISLAPESVPKA